MRKTITEHLDTVKREMIGIIDNFGSNHIDRATGASQQIEDNISHSFNESKSYLNNVSKATGESTEININKIKGKINEIESKSVEISKSASVLTSADWDTSKQQWSEKSSQIVNDITNNSSAIKSNIEKETSAYKALIEATDLEIMSAYNEQVEGTTRITDSIFEKMNLTANKEFTSAEDVLQKNSKTAMANIASTTETTLNQATRRFDSAKNAINASITLMSTMLETQSSNLLKKMRDSASENQDTLTEYFNNTINQINNVLEDLNKETESNLNGLTKQCEGVTSKSGKKMEQISRKALNQTNEVIDIFMEEFKLQKNVSVDRLVDILHEMPSMLNHLQTKWTTQQESEIISTYAKIQEQYRKLQSNWDKFIADASREMALFIPK
ncbi:MAG: hypothetical protein GY870_10120 [archaeon]|nr:hypothetical protein [archaeon]